MSIFSLRTLIDDIFLIVRNNNISESEDLSRAQVAAWILQYRSALIAQEKDKSPSFDADWSDDTFSKIIGPMKLEKVDSLDDTDLHTYRTTEAIGDLLNNNKRFVLAVYDQEHCPIQYMNATRKHFHQFRKYTAHELTWDMEKNYVYVHGVHECGLGYVWVKYISSEENADDEDEVFLPATMASAIKDLIFKNELAAMIKMPSDDSNNSTLDGIKPGSPQQTSRASNEK